jgi:hypothetical protein
MLSGGDSNQAREGVASPWVHWLLLLLLFLPLMRFLIHPRMLPPSPFPIAAILFCRDARITGPGCRVRAAGRWDATVLLCGTFECGTGRPGYISHFSLHQTE